MEQQGQRQARAQTKYSKAAVQFCLTMKHLFNLVLCQAMGSCGMKAERREKHREICEIWLS